MRIRLAIVVALLCCAAPASAQIRFYNREGGPQKANGTYTPGDCAIASDANNLVIDTCPGGGSFTADTGGTASSMPIDMQGGDGIDTAESGGNTIDFAFDATEVRDRTWGDAGEATHTWTHNLSTGRDPVVEFTDNLLSSNTPIRALAGNATFTTSVNAFETTGATWTMSGAGLSNRGVQLGGTVVWNDDAAGSNAIIGFHADQTHRNEAGEARDFGATEFGFLDRSRFICDGAACTFGGGFGTPEGVTAAPEFSTENGGTFDVPLLYGFSNPGVIGAGVTVASWLKFRAASWIGAGTVEKLRGIQIEDMVATEEAIGLVNLDTTSFWPPSPQSVSGGTAINVNTTGLELTMTGDQTMTATPSLANAHNDGYNGQFAILVNADTADTVTLRDETLMAGSNLRLRSERVTLGPKRGLALWYSPTVGDWIDLVPPVPDGGTTDLTCGAGTQGFLQVMDAGGLQWCDGQNTTPPAEARRVGQCVRPGAQRFDFDRKGRLTQQKQLGRLPARGRLGWPGVDG